MASCKHTVAKHWPGQAFHGYPCQFVQAFFFLRFPTRLQQMQQFDLLTIYGRDYKVDL